MNLQDFMGIMAEVEFYYLFRDIFASLDRRDVGFVKAADLDRILCGVRDLISDDTRVFLRDCYDHTIQIMDLLETYRDMSVSMLDIYLSSISNRMNEIMRVLTIIATIFIPLTFIVGVYGMNFGNNGKSPWAMPELNWYYGYPLLWLLMIGVAVGMLIYFWRKRWL